MTERTRLAGPTHLRMVTKGLSHQSNTVVDNGPFTDDLSIKNSDAHGVPQFVLYHQGINSHENKHNIPLYAD